MSVYIPSQQTFFFFFKRRLLITNRSDRFEFASPSSHCLLSVRIVNAYGGSQEGAEQTETKSCGSGERTLGDGA